MSTGRFANSRWPPSLGVLVVGVATYGFQQTAITPALPVVQHDLDASRQWTAWLFSGYLIVASVTPIFLGKLADRSGKRRVFVGSLTVFLLGSVGAALAPSIELVVLCRVVQGVGGAVFPLSFSIARDELPPERLAAGIGLLSGAFGVGSVAGYALGGLITQLLSWRWIFWIGAIVLAVAIVLVRVTVPPSPRRPARRLDTPGGLLFGAAMAALIVAITEAPGRGWGSPFVVAMLLAAVGCALAWLVWELHTAEPLLDLRVLGSRPILLTNASTLLSGYALFGVNLALPFLLEDGGGGGPPLTGFGLAAGPLLTGVVLLPRGLGQVLGSPYAERLTRAFGQRTVFAVGTALMGGGAGALALWRSQLWIILLELAVMGVGFGITVSVSGHIVTASVDAADTGIATSMNSVFRRVGGGIGAEVAAAFMASLTVAGTETASTAAFTTAFAVCAVVAGVGALCALMVTTGRGAARRIGAEPARGTRTDP